MVIIEPPADNALLSCSHALAGRTVVSVGDTGASSERLCDFHPDVTTVALNLPNLRVGIPLPTEKGLLRDCPHSRRTDFARPGALQVTAESTRYNFLSWQVLALLKITAASSLPVLGA